MNGSGLGMWMFLCCVFTKSGIASEWGYSGVNGPSHWFEDSPKCAGKSQSPVDIKTEEVLIDPNLKMLGFIGYGQTLAGGTFVNNGHSVQLNFPANKTFKISGGGMGDDTYTALQLHFHWAAPGSKNGSEHTINGKQYPVEMHIVHIKDPYTCTEQVEDMPDGLAVLGVFLDVGTGGNPAFQELFTVAKSCLYKDMSAPLKLGPRLFSLLPDSGFFYRYSGSLTTPPCYQAVEWTVFQQPMIISDEQLEILQSLKSVTKSEAASEGACTGGDCETVHRRAVGTADDASDSLGGNYRPVQQLNGRIASSFLDIGYTEHGHVWTYEDHLTGTSQWVKTFPVCGQMSQSPIDIDPSAAASPDSGKPESANGLAFNGYADKLEGTFVNNGHSVKLNFADNLEYVINEGGLNSSYKALQLHFHWGELLSNGEIRGGSEHTVKNERYAAEMHIVHGKTSELAKLSSEDAYVVLGVFVKVYESQSDNDDGANPHMEALFDAISKVSYSGDETAFPQGPSLDALLPDDKSFYRYHGSLTTPPCSEKVIWTVFSEPITISLNQFISFQRLFSAEASQVFNRDSIEAEKEIALKEDLSRAEKTKESADVGGGRSLPENAGTETLHSLKSNSTSSAPFAFISNSTQKHLLRNNYRPVQELNGRTVYYYALTSGPVEPPGLPVWEIVVFAVAGVIVFMICILIVMRCCRKSKNAGYSAGQPSNDGPFNL